MEMTLAGLHPTAPLPSSLSAGISMTAFRTQADSATRGVNPVTVPKEGLNVQMGVVDMTQWDDQPEVLVSTFPCISIIVSVFIA